MAKTAEKVKKTAEIWDLTPSDMTDKEFTVYCIIAALIIIGCCVACCILKKILCFAILIAVFVVCIFMYLYVYRNPDATTSR